MASSIRTPSTRERPASIAVRPSTARLVNSVCLTTRYTVRINVRISDRQAKGQVFMPMHFREAAANLLTNPQLDPYARIAAFKVSAVRIEKAGTREPALV